MAANPDLATALLLSHQHTLNAPICLSGIGLHTGQTVEVTLHPAPIDAGRYFVRTDLSSGPIVIPACIDALHQTVLSTELIAQGATVRTVEHLLAALAGLGIDNVRIEVCGPEIPLLDGSAREWVQAIFATGWTSQAELRNSPIVGCPIAVQKGDAFVMAVPAEETRLTYGIDFPHPAIGRQWCSVRGAEFATEIAPARTFGFAEEVDKLRARGLIKGGSLENALVCGTEGWLNPPLRYPDEPVRHKLLDLVGDLSLMGTLPKAHILAYKASHALHTQFVRRLVQLQ
ncbi:UDP-3-O-acyl-N-acetylglucosamine deacetylase [Altericista sp. CCNU0014]|uniref:UDP-3-O-acyl-N-acetylglucosamine deacetylase n=1 Tax=Altericista sp. CCNU0014 TaxID=3082949 RepID=UPI00384C9F49